MNSIVRQSVTSGSSDLRDIFLEDNSLYRKRTYRDGSSLFRVVAEQLYDTQSLSNEVRQECVRFMTMKRRRFEKYIEGDFDDYMLKMSQKNKPGTMLELRAMCFLYRRNVHLYEPLMHAKTVIFNENFENYFSVFYAPKNHFESVFTMEYYQLAALSQAVTYKILYKGIFKMPDVEVAVEKLLYPDSFSSGQEVQMGNRFILPDGRIFLVDMPHYTSCVMQKINNCSFHNLSNCYLSCVRQLLNKNVRPFKYVVAKLLDPYIYRNIELDVWRDNKRRLTKHLQKRKKRFQFLESAKCCVQLVTGTYIGYLVYKNEKKGICRVFIKSMKWKVMVSLEQVQRLPPHGQLPELVNSPAEDRSLTGYAQQSGQQVALLPTPITTGHNYGLVPQQQSLMPLIRMPLRAPSVINMQQPFQVGLLPTPIATGHNCNPVPLRQLLPSSIRMPAMKHPLQVGLLPTPIATGHNHNLIPQQQLLPPSIRMPAIKHPLQVGLLPTPIATGHNYNLVPQQQSLMPLIRMPFRAPSVINMQQPFKVGLLPTPNYNPVPQPQSLPPLISMPASAPSFIIMQPPFLLPNSN